ncbi:hypothetical protein POM88_000731 [Heracleum sosnowskyi]|uniref:TF-B3 domain-containing protein n=1 Tax=Heracleum sosnowskyi TaxID=360622 RepID=A0AAD8JEH3_9APIA|nr:hypothetical protein POM88_000731 [Heracleum sosnowskyi]
MSEKKAIKFVCLNFDELYKPGQLFLSLFFYADHSDELPEKVFFTMSFGDLWSGTYVKNRTYISGLEEMMRFYDKPRNGVEKVRKNCSDVEVWKHCSTLCYTTFFNSCASYKLEIVKEHLAGGDVVLGLDPRMTWMEVGVPKYKWKIGLNWTENAVQFDEVWKEFTEDLNLREGDTCVLQYTNHYQKFKVAIFEKSNILNFNLAGPEQGKSIMKFFKIVSEAMEETFHLDVKSKFSHFRDVWKKKDYITVYDGSRSWKFEIRKRRESKRTTIHEGGWKFVQNVYSTNEIVDEVVPPMSFLSNFASRMPARVKYVLHNGKSFNGYYLRNAFDLLGFTFDVFHSFTVCCFDGRNVESVIDDRLGASGEFGESLFPPFEFVVDVQQFHVRVQFRELRDMWSRNEQIIVYKDDCSWPIQIKKRPDWKRTTIHDGWLQFHDDLGLNIGDQCIFKWKDRSYKQFIVEVVKAVGVAP